MAVEAGKSRVAGAPEFGKQQVYEWAEKSIQNLTASIKDENIHTSSGS